MNESTLHTLSLLIDGEETEPQALLDALDAPQAIEALRDFARLRARVRDDGDVPSAAFYAAARRTVGPARRARWWRPIPVPAPVLAALVVAAIGAGVWVLMPRSPDERPPVPVRVLKLIPDEAAVQEDGR